MPMQCDRITVSSVNTYSIYSISISIHTNRYNNKWWYMSTFRQKRIRIECDWNQGGGWRNERIRMKERIRFHSWISVNGHADAAGGALECKYIYYVYVAHLCYFAPFHCAVFVTVSNYYKTNGVLYYSLELIGVWGGKLSRLWYAPDCAITVEGIDSDL